MTFHQTTKRVQGTKAFQNLQFGNSFHLDEWRAILVSKKKKKNWMVMEGRKDSEAYVKTWMGGFPGGSTVKGAPANAGDTSSILVGEESTCRRATKPVRPNYWACALENGNCNCWAHIQRLRKPARPRAVLHKPLQCQAWAPQLEKAWAKQQRPSSAKNKKIKL